MDDSTLLRETLQEDSTVKRWCGPGEDEGPGKLDIGVIEDSHHPRIETLRRMHELWTSPGQEDRDPIRKVELGTATPTPSE